MIASPAPRSSAALSAAQGRSRLSLRHLGGGFPHSQGRPRCLFVSMPNDRGRCTPTIRYGCGSSEGTSCGLRNSVVDVAGLVDASLFLVEVVAPVGLEVAVAA